MEVICEECGKTFDKLPSQIAYTNHNFCSRSCAGLYNGRQRKPGPYMGRQGQYERARALRKEGYGYHTIAKMVDVPFGTARNWVEDIPADPQNAFELSLCSRPFEELKGKSAMRKRLLAERNACWECGLTSWRGKKISLELHHIDGDKKNNARENLMLLCPNCHTQTPNYRNKKQGSSSNNTTTTPTERKRRKRKFCIDCGSLITDKARRCKECAIRHLNKHKIDWPPLDELEQMIRETNYSAVARQLGITDNGIRKHIELERRYAGIGRRH